MSASHPSTVRFDRWNSPEMGELLSLKILGLDGNLLTGSIPREIGNLTMLEEMYLTLNNLTRMMSRPTISLP